MPHKFRRQEPIGPFITDFCCYESRLIVEVDGVQHLDAQDYDDRHDAFLESEGFSVLRVEAYDVMANLDWVLSHIQAALPPPKGEVSP